MSYHEYTDRQKDLLEELQVCLLKYPKLLNDLQIYRKLHFTVKYYDDELTKCGSFVLPEKAKQILEYYQNNFGDIISKVFFRRSDKFAGCIVLNIEMRQL